MFFLTEVDTERANIRGSRDPLGLVPVWGAFGRKVVGNLTTASTTVRGFTTVLLGFHFAERILQRQGDSGTTRLEIFMRFEQLAGFVRKLRHDDDRIRGITEIKRRLADPGRSRIRIGSATNLQILSNQKTYGLWGLYTVPSIDSGWLLPRDLVLTESARTLVEREYLPVLRAEGLGEGRAIEDLLARPSFEFEPDGRHKRIADALAKVLSDAMSANERTDYHHHLIEGGPAGSKKGWQPRFARLLEDTLPREEVEFRHEDLLRIIRAASKTKSDLPLAHHLEQIRDLEALLVTMGNLFGFLQSRDAARSNELKKTLVSVWGNGLSFLRPLAIDEMQAEISRIYGDAGAGRRIFELSQALHSGDFAAAISLLLSHNQYVMKARHGSEPWIQWKHDQLSVRYRDGSDVSLMAPRQLATAWRSSFYLNPLKTVSDQLRTA